MLEREQAKCERLALFEKTEKVFSQKGPKKSQNQSDDSLSLSKIEGGRSHSMVPKSPMCCHICGQTSNHVITERGEKNSYSISHVRFLWKKNVTSD